MPLPLPICSNVLYHGVTSSSNKWASLSTFVGTEKASCQPLYQLTNPIMYLLPDKVFGYGPETSKPNFAKG